MNNFFTSDLHLGHEKIIELCNRPFHSITQMNQHIVWNWNDVVKDEDNVFVLGDLALGKLDESLIWAKYLRGNKYLVPGNHDRCWSGNKKIRPQDTQKYIDAGFKILGEDITDILGWRLCHFPYSGDSQDKDRYQTHRPVRGKEIVLLHGHVHNSWKIVMDWRRCVGFHSCESMGNF